VEKHNGWLNACPRQPLSEQLRYHTSPASTCMASGSNIFATGTTRSIKEQIT